MRNVIVFAVGAARYAIELRWVREVFPLGHVTPIPRAPSAVVGVFNLRGAIVPLLDVEVLFARDAVATGIDHGDSGIVIEVDDTAAALRATRVLEVSTLAPPSPERSDEVVDSTGLLVLVLDPPALLQRLKQAATAVAAVASRGVGDERR